jgi:hypothetical protein
MTSRLYISASWADRERSRKASELAVERGWLVTGKPIFSGPADQLVGEKKEVQRDRETVAEQLSTIQDCDVFLHLGAGVAGSYERERALGAALIHKQMGHKKRILVSLQGEGTHPLGQPPSNLLCEVYQDDEEALAALGLPGPAPWEPLYGPPGLWIGQRVGNTWNVREVRQTKVNSLDEPTFIRFGYLRFPPGVTAAVPWNNTHPPGWAHVREIAPDLSLVRLIDGTTYTETSHSLWKSMLPWEAALFRFDPNVQDLRHKAYELFRSGRQEGDPERATVEAQLQAYRGLASWEYPKPVTAEDRQRLKDKYRSALSFAADVARERLPPRERKVLRERLCWPDAATSEETERLTLKMAMMGIRIDPALLESLQDRLAKTVNDPLKPLQDVVQGAVREFGDEAQSFIAAFGVRAYLAREENDPTDYIRAARQQIAFLAAALAVGEAKS